MKNQNSLAKVEQLPDELALSDYDIHTANNIQSVVTACSLGLRGAVTSDVQRALVMARGIKLLRALLTDELMQRDIMPLMNCKLGFKTDKDPHRKSRDGNQTQPYPLAIVKDCVIEAMLSGARVVGNEFNIISSQSYLTKEYFTRAVGELDGVTDVVPSPGVPQMQQGKALIRYGLSWRKDGKTDMLKDAEGKPGRVFEIRTDAYSSVDQVLGKADRKAYAAAYRQITGSALSLTDGEVDGDIVDGTIVDAKDAKRGTSAVKDLLNQRKADASGNAPSEPETPPAPQPVPTADNVDAPETNTSDASEPGGDVAQEQTQTEPEPAKNDEQAQEYTPFEQAVIQISELAESRGYDTARVLADCTKCLPPGKRKMPHLARKAECEAMIRTAESGRGFFSWMVTDKATK